MNMLKSLVLGTLAAGFALTARAAATENVTNLVARLDLLTANVISNYLMLTDIPRQTYHEKAVSDALVVWAKARGFKPTQDAQNNVWFDVPATAGLERKPRVILQGHMDMVAVGSSNPQADPVVLDCDDAGAFFSKGRRTSIGADDGIGVALAMTIADGKVPHGPVRVLVTTDEEQTQTGAQAVPADVLRGAHHLINIDSEDDGELTISSAACDDISVTGAVTTASAVLPAAYGITIGNFRGGHSGVDIDKDRLNAIIELGCILTNAVARGVSFELAAFNGGDANNAIPPHAEAFVRTDESSRVAFEALLAEAQAAFRARGETNAVVGLTETNGFGTVISATSRTNLLAYLTTVHNGVWGMSQTVPGLVETSINLGLIRATQDGVGMRCFARGCEGERLQEEESSVAATAEACGYVYRAVRSCAPWPADPENPLVTVFSDIWRTVVGGDMKVVATHGGLECGWFASKAPALNVVSVGPTIKNPHTVNETTYASSVSNGVRLLSGVLASLPDNEPDVPFPAANVGVCSWSWATNMTTILEQMDTMGVKCMQLSLVPWVKPLYGIEYDASLRETFKKGESGDVFLVISNRIAKGEISVLSTMISFPFERWGSYQAISNSNGIVCNIATNDAVGKAVSEDDPLGLAAWTVNSNLVDQAAAMTRQLGVRYITTELGYLDKPMIDHDTNANANAAIGLARLYEVHRLCAQHGIRLLFESGQYSGEGTMALIDAYTNRYAKAAFDNAYGLTVNDIGINYDTANHLIYENDSSTNAFAVMSSRIPQIHVKDTYESRADREKAGGFAVDVKWGTADVSGKLDTLAFLKQACFKGNLLVEHEWGTNRVGDINAALKAILLANNDDPDDPWISPTAMTGESAGEKCEAALKAQGFSRTVAGRLADVNLYGGFRGWTDDHELEPDGLVTRSGVILASACNAPAVADPTDVAMTIEDLEVGTNTLASTRMTLEDFASTTGGTPGITMTFLVNVAAEGYDGPIDVNLLKAALGVEGTTDLETGAFSSDTLDVAFGEVTEGRISVRVVPKNVGPATPERFFIRTTAE